MSLIVFGIVLPGLTVGLGGGLGYQVLRQKHPKTRPMERRSDGCPVAT
jgi:hypothetical protein